MPIQVLHDETIHDGRWVRLVRRHFVDTAGGRQEWEMVQRRTHGPIVAVAAVTTDGALVLNRIYRVPLRGWVLELPAGLMDKAGEQPEEVARRELLEETGYDAPAFTPIMSGPFNTGLTSDVLTIYGAREARRVRAPHLEPAEDIEVMPVPVREVEALLTRPPEGLQVDLKLFGILWWLQQQR